MANVRIAFVVDQFPILSETFILNQIVGLIERGHEIDIYSDRQGDTSKVNPEVERYQLLKRTYYTRMPPRRPLRVLKSIGLLLANLYKNPIVLLRSLNLFNYNFSKYGEQGKILKLFYSAIPLLRQQPYNIIHAHYGRNGLRCVLLQEIGLLQGKLVTSFHGYDVNDYPRRYGAGVYKILVQKGDLYTVNSTFTKHKAIALGFPQQKFIKLPVGVDMTKYIFQPHILNRGENVKILTVARLVEKKGIEYSIRAVAKAIQKHPQMEYQIIGEGPQRKYLESLIAELKVGDRVKLLGWKTQDELRQFYADAHIFVLSSVTAADGDQEGQGLVLQEAQAMGLPVVATLHNGFPDSVLDGKSAFLVPERDIDALADRIGYLIEHPEVWPQMGLTGRTFVEENFDINKLNDRLVEIYQKLIS